ncbi:phosphoenolpyruvate carboxylase [Niabella ginsenosidivorans]|uniref:Phosphoenolpyruvate carboxylase n=1 Tax=Niabella ginsenosidivorans TaxID=1176587 RepID=A0A1A9HZ86_9BACT|nr:phosphoenolpyruvate carboxylase [Niabella ginsenosidivorans]ANH79742.1 phosphoenolpyruvate carboxylase [Niabella ginsenosidivorans]
MDVVASQSVQRFKNDVGVRFQLYNSLFTSLPFHKIEKTGILLSLLSNMCEEGYEKGLSPVEILEDFFSRHTSFTTPRERLDLLFRLVQYVERQVVLFDALEDASYKKINDFNGPGTLKQLMSAVAQNNKEAQLDKVLEDFCVRLVLTAHPTQFYPGSVLGIIRDLSNALVKNDASEINTLLQQLGKTPFFKKNKPTPFDEAVSLIWYLENVFYPAAGRILSELKNQFPDVATDKHTLIKMGFWPGGDRDGNPFVTTDTTLQVAAALRAAILKCYYFDVRRLKRRLTFHDVEDIMSDLERRLYEEVFIPGHEAKITDKEIISILEGVKKIVNERANGLFVSRIQDLISKIEIFGLHFASLDIRQDSSIHEKVFSQVAASQSGILPENYDDLGEKEKVKLLLNLKPLGASSIFKDDVVRDTVEVVNAICSIQKSNGEQGCNRYIISHATSVLSIIEVIGLFKLNGISSQEMNVDIVPLFETIDDLQNAGDIMKTLYSLPEYKAHLGRRGKTQTIMLGFSDGTKDGGYLMANWCIYRAKEELTRITRQYGFDVIFFDGRGGPPSRGGGKTHKFYASMGRNISNKEIQLTIQGQTVSANFGIIDSAQFNIEQLINAGVSSSLFSDRYPPLNGKQEQLLQELSSYGFDAYIKLKNHPQLANYLYEISPLRFYSETNIGSRPAKRGKQTSISLGDLRAIPFSGAWSQLKQNVPGFFGVGTALKQMEYIGRFDELKQLYNDSLYFKTLLDNCEMAMSKSYFPITAYIAKDQQFGDIWKMIYDEFVLTKQYIYKLTGHDTLMASYPVDKLSIRMRERIVMPLVTIQQYALVQLREGNDDKEESLHEVLGKLVMRCSFGIINAGRNSA